MEHSRDARLQVVRTTTIHFLTVRYTSRYRCHDTIRMSIYHYINNIMHNGKVFSDEQHALSVGAQDFVS